jgi:hypothetical protein
MTGKPRRVTLDEIREAIHRAAEVTNSYRGLGREIGASPQGLHNFLDGAEPRPGMRLRLTRWYLAEIAKTDDGTTAGHADAALYILTRHLPEARRIECVESLLADIEANTRAAGMAPPDWLAELRGDENGDGA